MKLRYITCSDPRENLAPVSLMRLLNISPLAEIGVQAHPSAMMRGRPRYIWFRQLLDAAKLSNTPVNIALHINYKWCDEICSGNIPGEIKCFLSQKHSFTHQPLVSRIQLNIGDYTNNFDAEKLAHVISNWKKFEVILPFNKNTKPQIEELRKTRAQFSLLFDGSYGAGVSPNAWNAPVYDNVVFGYAGGISPTNVCENLDKIARVLPADYETWIDAEGRLRDRTGAMDIERAKNYLVNAIKWNNQNTK